MKIISIGPYCATADILKKHNLRQEAYPFDYIFSSLEMVKHCINNKFNIFLDKKYYTNGTNNNSTKHTFYCKFLDTDILLKHHIAHRYSVNYKVSSGNLFNHHNLLLHKEHYKAFERRCKRFLDVINEKNNKNFLVYYDKYTNNINDLVEFANYIKYYNEKIYVIGIFEKKNDGKKILYNIENCTIYQNYNPKYIFDKEIFQ